MDISENDISKIVYEAGYIVHKSLGPGLLESAYEECLFYELNKFDILVERQKPMPLVYDEVKMDIGYRLDFLIEKKICAGNKIHRIITRYSFSTNTYIPSPK